MTDDTETYDPFKEFNKTFEPPPPSPESGNGEAAPEKKRGRPKGFKLKVGGSGKSVAKARAQQESHPRKGGRPKKTPQPVVTDPGALVTQIVEENKRLRGIIMSLYEFLGKQI